MYWWAKQRLRIDKQSGDDIGSFLCMIRPSTWPCSKELVILVRKSLIQPNWAYHAQYGALWGYIAILLMFILYVRNHICQSRILVLFAFNLKSIKLTNSLTRNICRILAPRKDIKFSLCLLMNCTNLAKYLTGFCLLCAYPWLVSIGSRIGLAPTWCQAISWSNDVKDLCCLLVNVDLSELALNPKTLAGVQGPNVSQIFVEIHSFSLKKCLLSSQKNAAF